MTRTPSVRNNMMASFAGKAWAGLFTLAFVPLYIKLMGVEVYGLLGIFMSLTALLSLLDMGLTATLSRELSRLSALKNSEAESRNLVRTFEVIYWGIGILIGIAVIILAPFISEYWIQSGSISRDIVGRALTIMGLSIAFQWPSTIYSGGLMGLQQHVVLNAIRSVTVTVQYGGVVPVLLFISPSIVSFFLWQSFAGLLGTILSAVWLWRVLPKSERATRFDKELLRKNWQFASGMIGISLVTVLLTQLDKIILSKMLSLEMFGYYMLAFNLAIALNNLVSPILSALFPRFTQLVATEEEGKLIALYHKGCRLLSVLVLPAAITMAIFAKDILALWIGDAATVQNTHLILTLLMIGTAINAVMTLPYTLQIAYGWTKLTIYKNIMATALLVPLMVWMIQLYQGVGAAWVWIILNLGYFIFEVPIMHRRLLRGEMGNWYGRDVILPVVIVAGIGLIGRAILPADSSRLMALLGVSGIFALSVFVSAWAAGYFNILTLKFTKP